MVLYAENYLLIIIYLVRGGLDGISGNIQSGYVSLDGFGGLNRCDQLIFADGNNDIHVHIQPYLLVD